MHELSIAQAVVELVEEEAKKADAKRVVSLTLSLGELSGVVEDQLRFCFPIVAEGTLLAGAKLEIEPVDGSGYCLHCEEAFHLTGLLEPCPRCGSLTSDIRSGQDLLVASIEVE